ncbi:RimK/LysX family protein [Desulfogranum marinum]|uniref:ATP-dependent zinc protease family protein n=1 Tax=Desulfogranum marinum TaxID=453220 RepID=UPI0029C73B57|nr:RimK/LysX family protein [Desulfogranum marinum]
MAAKKRVELPIIGWREWVKLPDLGIDKIKAKVDSGARSSSIHAFNIKKFHKDGEQWVRFSIHPIQRSKMDALDVEAKVLESRSIKSSNGIAKIRPVILTKIELLGKIWEVELTLASRDNMGFRMLLGREAFRNRFLVDCGRSYYGGKPEKQKKTNTNNRT